MAGGTRSLGVQWVALCRVSVVVGGHAGVTSTLCGATGGVVREHVASDTRATGEQLVARVTVAPELHPHQGFVAAARWPACWQGNSLRKKCMSSA